MADNFYGITDTGKMRDNNEDNFIAQKIMNGKYIAGCVIDGVGGYEGGEVAAGLTRTAILSTLKRASGDIVYLLKTAFAEANKQIFERKQNDSEHIQMACVATLALVDINVNKFYYAHVGDTRLYLFRDNSLVKVTHDHSFVGFLEESGRLTEDAAMNHPKRNEINKALGFDEDKFLEADYIETGESPFLPGDTLLLCSDGLSDMVNSRTISGILNAPHTLKEKSNALIEAANLAGGKDNITVVLIRNDKSPLQHEATKPLSIKKEEPVEAIVKEERVGLTDKEVAVKKRGGVFVRFLLVLCLFLMAVVALFVYNDYFKDQTGKKIISDDIIPFERNAQVNKLSDNIKNAALKTVSLKNVFGNTPTVFLNDSLLIKNDSLHINGNGITLQPDSAYNGAAFIFFPQCKYILLDSLVFENFDMAFVMRNQQIHLRNVRFKNCRVPILRAMQLPNNVSISGNISDTAFLQIDSAKTIVQIQ